MIRRVNDMKGFHVQDTTNINMIDTNKYPEQESLYVNRWLTLRFFNAELQQNFYRFNITSDYRKKYNIPSNKESNHPRFFRVVRFDKDAPNKAILISNRGEVIVSTTDKLRTLYTLQGAHFCDVIKSEAEFKDYEYLDLNDQLLTPDSFFPNYLNEYVHEFPVQAKYLVGAKVYIEFHSSIIDNTNRNSNQLKNDFTFTNQMKANLIKGDSKLANLDDNRLDEFPYTYNVHAFSNIDIPRRYSTTGVIIRADLRAADPRIVVMEYSDSSNSARFICDDEANFYYNTEEQIDNRNVYNLTRARTPLGYAETPKEVENDIESTENEQENIEENNMNTIEEETADEIDNTEQRISEQL